MRLWFTPRCCECGQRTASIPYAKRGRRLLWVCRACYFAFDYASYFFHPLEER